jgi:hypothetical protein
VYGIMSTGAIPSTIGLTGNAALTMTGSVVLDQPWWQLIGA